MTTNCKYCKAELIEKNTRYGAVLACPNWQPKNKGCKGMTIKIQAKKIVPTPPTFKPNQDQQAILNWLGNADKGKTLVVNADSGTGKTATLSLISWMLKSKSVYLAFGRENAKEANNSGKFSSLVGVSTFHALMFKVIRENVQKVKVNDHKIHNYIFDQCQNHPIAYAVQDVINGLKNLLLSPTEENINQVIERLGIEIKADNLSSIIEYAKLAYPWSIDLNNKNQYGQFEIDFSDMLTLPLIKNWEIPTFNYVLVDEAQDQNPARIKIIEKISHDQTIKILVGDEKQAIMGFTGAAYDSMSQLVEKFKADQLPLQITYRYNQTILEFVKTNSYDVKTITMNKGNGRAEYVGEYDTQPNDLVLCRNNAPLAKYALELILQGKKVQILGKDVKSGLVNLLYSLGNRSTKLDDALSNANKIASEITSKKALANFLDKLATLDALSSGLDYLGQLIDRINEIFSEKKDAIILATIHKSKGLEAKNVIIIESSLIPSKHAKTDDEIKQELNLWYVALTRAIDNLLIFA